jgi:hypothetical protein
MTYLNRYLIRTYSSQINITNCVFSNSINITGGIIYAVSQNNYYIYISGCLFQDLITSCSKGLILSDKPTISYNTAITVIDNEFINIHSNYSGALSVGGLFTILFSSDSNSVVFINNSFSHISFDAGSGKGSILYLTATKILSFTFQNNSFDSISSSMFGALFVNTTLDASKFTIDNCSFVECQSSYGGAIYFCNVLFLILFFFYFLFFFFF